MWHLLAEAAPAVHTVTEWAANLGTPAVVGAIGWYVFRRLFDEDKGLVTRMAANHIKHVDDLGACTRAIEKSTTGIGDTLRVMETCQAKQAEALKQLVAGTGCRHPRPGN